ncbi:mandelate racemase/muconate lactonizing enzyme family protein [Paenibacillus thalictri]|uniref:Mandelate racemase/muconate lactonizing enzyme family protein n=1 Tax=Paenibacillus thalictri TaxID=2527873 RepID=A0A4Q9DSM7_9BACL|nr:mandelate racemase/muconate lactonizing enzyme family protein [Paenibacillus thalictri]TBL79897.1 mandelate racemase/muconate lactonizing enzyme family protein [Paenibacillus thalictri]
MKIVDVKTENYAWPRPRPITNGKHTYSNVRLAMVKIETDEGITGIGLGEAIGNDHDIFKAIAEYLKPQLIGEDPINVERLWHKMWVPKLVGRRGLTTRVISAIDIGLWDLKGKVTGIPLYKLLGGYRDSVPAYIAGGYYEEGKGLKELQDEMLQYVSWGARAVKMKVGALSLHEDAKRVKAVREAVGPEIKILLDANCAYRYYDAVRFARLVEEYDPFWFEEPVAAEDYEGLAKLAAKTSIPLATGENEYTRYGFRDLIAQKAVPILNADPKILGGFTEFMKVAALAQAHDLDIAPHGLQDVNIHVVPAIANGLLLEYYPVQLDPMWEKVYNYTLKLSSDGTVSPPDLPGLGVEPNYEELAKYRIG